MEARELEPLPVWRGAAAKQMLKRLVPAMIAAVGVLAFAWPARDSFPWHVWVIMVGFIATTGLADLRRHRAESRRILLTEDEITFRKAGLDDCRIRREDVVAIVDQPGRGLVLFGEHGPLRTVPAQFEDDAGIRAVLGRWKPIIEGPREGRLTTWLAMAGGYLAYVLFRLDDPRVTVLTLILRIRRRLFDD